MTSTDFQRRVTVVLDPGGNGPAVAQDDETPHVDDQAIPRRPRSLVPVEGDRLLRRVMRRFHRCSATCCGEDSKRSKAGFPNLRRRHPNQSFIAALEAGGRLARSGDIPERWPRRGSAAEVLPGSDLE
jgi:hypothetical protein